MAASHTSLRQKRARAHLALHLRLGDILLAAEDPKSRERFARRSELGKRLNRTALTFGRAVRLAGLLSSALGSDLAVHAYADLPPEYELTRLPAVLQRYAGAAAPRMH